VKSHRVGKSFDREWRERVDAAVSRTLGTMRGREKFLGSLELSHQSVNRLPLHVLTREAVQLELVGRLFLLFVHQCSHFKIEISGKNRMNRNSSARKSPMVPKNV